MDTETTDNTYHRNALTRAALMDMMNSIDWNDHTLLTAHFPSRITLESAVKYHRQFFKTLNRKIYGRDGRFFKGHRPRRQITRFPILENHDWNDLHSHILLDRPEGYTRQRFTLLLQRTWNETRLTREHESPLDILKKNPHVTYDNISIQEKTGNLTKYRTKDFTNYADHFDFENLHYEQITSLN